MSPPGLKVSNKLLGKNRGELPVAPEWMKRLDQSDVALSCRCVWWWKWMRRVKKTSLKLNIQETKITASGPITSWQIDGETMETVTDFIFWGSKIIADGDCSHEIKRHLLLGRKAMTNLDSIVKKQRHYFANKGPSNRSYVFSSSHVWIWELDHEKNWALKNWCFWSVVLKTLESPLDCKEIKPINPEGDQSWIFTGRTDAEAETPILWPLLTNSLEKTLMLGKIEGRRKWLDGITGSMDMS